MLNKRWVSTTIAFASLSNEQSKSAIRRKGWTRRENEIWVYGTSKPLSHFLILFVMTMIWSELINWQQFRQALSSTSRSRINLSALIVFFPVLKINNITITHARLWHKETKMPSYLTQAGKIVGKISGADGAYKEYLTRKTITKSINLTNYGARLIKLLIQCI